ncbi:porin [Cognatishimia activa]|uniref:Porin n=1 Tax=Cognatishimia activa TaxID=1715691 RepID=A0A0P1ILC7_9RHOB|nr:porin [Cognatishimia activa]CUI56750.1 Porin [Cognatishimia activa]CUK24401.1 Porin [Cognatishimia activa]
MKKVLFASTALVMTAGVASAEITLSGSANMGIKGNAFNGSIDAPTFAGETTVHNEIDIDVVGTGETDGGLTFGASVDLDASSDDSANTTGGGASDPEVFVSYNGLTLTVGDIGEAQAVGGVADVGYDGLGVDDLVDDLADGGAAGLGGSDDVRVDYAFGDIAVALSADSNSGADTGVAVSVSGTVDAFDFAVGYADRQVGGVDFTQSTVTVGYSAGAFSVGATYAQHDSTTFGKLTGYGVDVSYTTGDVTVTGVYTANDLNGNAPDQSAFGLGVAYDLGGATLSGGVASIDLGAGSETVADLGISFKF